jgi:hypothetical protein
MGSSVEATEAGMGSNEEAEEKDERIRKNDDDFRL